MGEINLRCRSVFSIVYLLDTNICIYIINKRPQKIIEKISLHEPAEIKISAVSIAEMEYGAAKSAYPEKNRNALRDFLTSFEIIPFDLKDAEIYGIILAELERNGEVIGPYDMQLASQALSRDYIFVTNNVQEFQRIRKLKLENWV
ncbi:virulence associated protein C [Treponema primitia ZAS-2]|uniref:Virulence associated protein C n=1 Tax=Treponema primitia (strain ATCC BAA-887 / DSM 12427 / ZAS-2) TaxID=545694 RepID=F5YN52_TREPZ|nr:virulence associated protein C [Treponema primitia ZAS-2]